VNRFRMRHPDHKAVKKSRPDDDSGSHDAELTDAAESVYDTAAQHRSRVIAKDKAAKARRTKNRG
jgi:hypothetical protein